MCILNNHIAAPEFSVTSGILSLGNLWDAFNLQYLSSTATLRCLLCFFLFVSPIAVWLRLPREWHGMRRFIVDDGFLAVALTTQMIHIGLALLSINNDISSLKNNPLTLSKALQYHFLAEIFYILSTTLLRISIVNSLFPLLTPSNFSILRRIDTSIPRILLVLNLFVGVEVNACFLIVVIRQCRPLVYFWTRLSGGRGWCVARYAMKWYEDRYAMISAGSGVSLFGLVYWVMSGGLKDWRSRVGLRCIALLGCLASLMVLMRMPMSKPLLRSEDISLDCVSVATSSTIEIGLLLLIFSACSLFTSSLDSWGTDRLELPLHEEKSLKQSAVYDGSRL